MNALPATWFQAGSLFFLLGLFYPEDGDVFRNIG
jgi:hypothetical protein